MKRNSDPDVRLLHAAADPSRLAILRELSACGSVCACDLAGCCDVAQPTLSHHLKVLREAGWVRSERRGSWVYYAIEPAAAERLRAIAGGLGPGDGWPAASLPARGRPLPVVQPGG